MTDRHNLVGKLFMFDERLILPQHDCDEQNGIRLHAVEKGEPFVVAKRFVASRGHKCVSIFTLSMKTLRMTVRLFREHGVEIT